jgi:hypothetical protein
LEGADSGFAHLPHLRAVGVVKGFPVATGRNATFLQSQNVRFVHFARVPAFVTDAPILNFGEAVRVAVIAAYRFVNAVVVRMLLGDRFAGWYVWHKFLSGDALQGAGNRTFNIAESVVARRFERSFRGQLESWAGSESRLNRPFTLSGTGSRFKRLVREIAPNLMSVYLAAFIAFVNVCHVNNVHNFQMEVNYYI